MIYYTIFSKTNHWSRRVKKIDDVNLILSNIMLHLLMREEILEPRMLIQLIE